MEESSGDEVNELLRARIESFEQLEVLLLLHRRADEGWTAASVSGELHIGVPVASDALDHLCRGNLLDVRVGKDALVFRFAPGTPELASAVELLVTRHQERRLDVVRMLSAHAMERVRTSAIRLFADAFLIGSASGKGKKDGKKNG